MNRINNLVVLGLLFVGTTSLAGGYADSLLAERADHDASIRAGEIGPFTAIGQALLRDGQVVRVALAADTILLDKPAADIGLPTMEIQWMKSSERVYVRTPMGGNFKIGHKRVGPVPLDYQPGDTILAEKFRLQVYYNSRGGRVMAFDPEHAKRAHFEGLNYFDPDEAWRVEAKVEPIIDGETVTMTTSLGLQKSYVRFALLHFVSPEGTPFQLTLFQPVDGGDWGFLPFTDATSGSVTYGGGRYIDLDLSKSLGETVVIDFNRAYNPYCAYTHYYNCPIPPSENCLSVAIEAGEKSYK